VRKEVDICFWRHNLSKSALEEAFSVDHRSNIEEIKVGGVEGVDEENIDFYFN